MNLERFQSLTANYARLRITVAGDFCLDRYLEIDPAKQEVSLETGLAVHNVTKVRSQPGGAGTILNNLVALGIGEVCPVGFAGEDGEGFELVQSLKSKRGVNLEHFFQTGARRTFTYCKPLLIKPGKPPEELQRLDSKNWTPTPAAVQARLVDSVQLLAAQSDAIILLDQVSTPETGVVTTRLLQAIREVVKQQPDLIVIADSRRGLRGYPHLIFKMNVAELASLIGVSKPLSFDEIRDAAIKLARTHGRFVFVTLAGQGLIGAGPDGEVEHVAALPVRGPIDIVGAGDAVAANLAGALAAGANLRESVEIANAAASVVIHQLGTTGTASVEQIRDLATSQ